VSAGLLERLGVAAPVVQAGMGGGLARHELAAAVSDAGGLGTIGFLGARALAGELAAARRLTGRPVAVNVLAPFATRDHWRVAAEADVAVTHWGTPRRRVPGVWVHQCGSVAEARAAHRAGADAVIAQGVEAGGHTRAQLRALDLLERIRAALPPDVPVLLAGGIAERGDVEEALRAGAVAAVLGTRFLMTPESRAHPAYKERLVAGRETVLTTLFGFGWPAPHRVLRNAATERWLRGGPRGPLPVRALNAAGGALARLPLRPATPPASRGFLLSPLAPVEESPAGLVDAGPLYAGETVARIAGITPAAALVGELAG